MTPARAWAGGVEHRLRRALADARILETRDALLVILEPQQGAHVRSYDFFQVFRHAMTVGQKIYRMRLHKAYRIR
jgi:hypothetical protein